MAKLFAIIWIPAFAGMTGWATGMTGGEAEIEIRRSRFMLGFGRIGLFAIIWIPAFAGMTGLESGNDGARIGDE